MDDNIVTDQERKRIEELARKFGQNIREKYEWAEDIMNEPSEQQIATGGIFRANIRRHRLGNFRIPRDHLPSKRHSQQSSKRHHH